MLGKSYWWKNAWSRSWQKPPLHSAVIHWWTTSQNVPIGDWASYIERRTDLNPIPCQLPRCNLIIQRFHAFNQKHDLPSLTQFRQIVPKLWDLTTYSFYEFLSHVRLLMNQELEYCLITWDFYSKLKKNLLRRFLRYGLLMRSYIL